jgi:acyl carrier protein
VTAEELLPRLKRLIVSALRLEGLRAEQITDDEALIGGRLGLDSVDALELVVSIEREFGIAIPGGEIGGDAFATPRSLASWLSPRLDLAARSSS